MALVIKGVFPNSIASEVGLEKGDKILRVNGREVEDQLDFRFHTSGEEVLELLVEKAQGEVWEVEIEREPDEDLGLIFEGIVPKRCPCKCIFCFMDQMPSGMRPSLYFKDDDYRLSFLHGNYITLTNLMEKDWRRLEEQRLSPLYVSLHATDSQVRSFMMGTPEAAHGYDCLKRLVSLGIKVHLQVVICPGINDGGVFEKTVGDVVSLYPQVASIAVVPVGITRFRQGLYPLLPVTREYARDFVRQASFIQKEAFHKLDSPFLFLSDEWYIKAGFPFPSLNHYGDLPQWEDGVGMVPLFLHEWRGLDLSGLQIPNNPFVLVTGEAFAPYLASCIGSSPLGEKGSVMAIRNRLFGVQVTVAGLLSGRDIIEGLKDAPCGEVIIPSVVLNDDGLFLDGLTPKDVAVTLHRKLRVVEATPMGVVGFFAAKSVRPQAC